MSHDTVPVLSSKVAPLGMLANLTGVEASSSFLLWKILQVDGSSCWFEILLMCSTIVISGCIGVSLTTWRLPAEKVRSE